jgi:hypothetical protein
MTAPLEPPPPGTTFTRDPVVVTTAIFTFLLAISSVLMITGVFSDVAGGIISGVIAAAWASTQLLFVKPATVPRQPLAQLAYDNQQPAGSVFPSSTPVVEVSDLPTTPNPQQRKP